MRFDQLLRREFITLRKYRDRAPLREARAHRSDNLAWNLFQHQTFFARMSSAVARRSERRGRGAELRGSEKCS